MQYNTIRQYQEGGASEGLDVKRALARAYLGKGIMSADEELQDEAKKVKKEGGLRGLLGSLGSFAGSYALPALATALFGPAGTIVTTALLKGAGAGIGRGLGETIGGIGAEDVSGSSSGFLAKDFDRLKDYQESLGKGIGGRALGQAAGTALLSFGTEGLKGLKESSKLKALESVVSPEESQKYRDALDLSLGLPTDPSGTSSALESIESAKSFLPSSIYGVNPLDVGANRLDMQQTILSNPSINYNDLSYINPNFVGPRMNTGGVVKNYAGGGLFNPMQVGRRLV
jgi:hypothetical protein